jgi:WD40 repeat protein
MFLTPRDITPTSEVLLLSTNTPWPQSTNTVEVLPTIAISNYLNFAPNRQWDIKNITRITGIALSPDELQVALFTLRYPEQWWLELRDSQNGDLIWDVNVGKAAYNALAFSPDGTLIGTGTEEGNVRIWDVENGNLIQTLEGHILPVRIVSFSPDGTMIASGASDNTARVWLVSTGVSLATYRIKTDVRDIAFSPDNQYLAVTSNHVAVFHIISGADTPAVYYDSEVETKDLGEVTFSGNGLFLVASADWYNPNSNQWRKRVYVWDFPYNQSAPIKIPVYDAVEDIVVSPDSQLILGVYKDKGQLLIINIVKREIVGNLDIGPKLYMSYSPDLSTFVVVSAKTTVTIWGISE